MVEYKKGVGINFSELAEKQQTPEKQETIGIPETMTGQEVADLFKKITANCRTILVNIWWIPM